MVDVRLVQTSLAFIGLGLSLILLVPIVPLLAFLAPLGYLLAYCGLALGGLVACWGIWRTERQCHSTLHARPRWSLTDVK